MSNEDQILTDEETLFIMRILMYIVTPAISLLGIVGNIFSIIILLKQGLHKCSNIVLISLAVTDLGFLIGFNSIPKILYEVVGVEHGFHYNEGTDLFLFILYIVFNILDYSMGYISLTIPMLITVERLVAVFFPFKFNQIITQRRTWTAVACVYLFWYSIVVYMSFWLEFEFKFDPRYNISIGTMQRSSIYFEHLHLVEVFDELNVYCSMKIPPILTLIGSILIGIKVKVASIKRSNLMSASSKEASSNRTTKMLLAVCAVYCFSCGVLSLPTYIPQYLHYTISSDAPSNLGRVMYQVMNIAVCINSSCNFVVYVAMNKNFRDTYKSLFAGCNKAKK